MSAPSTAPPLAVVAAMSGGVDSAVAAARAVEAGHAVTGVHLALSRNPASYRSGARGCCTIEDANDARRAADVLGIPFYVWDLSERFHEDVVEDFMDTYAAGRTPNPCLRCNEKIKFTAVLDRALGLGFDAVATGHYARLRDAPDGGVELHRAVDDGKDQSYVLGVLDQRQLAHSLFPLGDTPKPEVRAEAARRGLLVADKPDSHDICFIADGDNAGWLREKLGDRAPNHGGDIVDDATGEVLGQHEGTYAYTVGQRKGLRIGRPAPDGRPRFVLDIEPVSGHRDRRPARAPHHRRTDLLGTAVVRRRTPPAAGHRPAAGPRWPAAGRGPGRGRPGRRRAARAGPGCRTGPDGRLLRRHARGRQRRDRLHPDAVGMTTHATGVGSMPGDDQAAYDEALRLSLGLLGEASDGFGIPFLPEVPGRGVAAAMTGRALAVVAELGADLQPAGWRLTGSLGGAGVDHRRARSLLAQDLDALEERAQGLTGAAKVQVCGPWTLASTVERPRADAVLGDHGARRELAQALAEGLGDHVRDVRRRLPGVERLVVQVDEPSLPTVLAGRVRTASGLRTHRSVDLPEVSETLGWVLAAVEAAGGEPWVHSCAPGTPLGLLRGAGARGLSVDLDQLTAADHDVLGEALEAGESVCLGVVPATDPGAWPTEDAVTARVERWLEMLGVDPGAVDGSFVLGPACGLAGASPQWAREALRLSMTAARNIAG